MIAPFGFVAGPQVHFGVGKISILPASIKTVGSSILLITGAHSFIASPHRQKILEQLQADTVTIESCTIDTEPTPVMIDAIVKKFSSATLHAVVAIGGGSVLDAGKAIAAMLPLNKPVKNYLEGVGTLTHPGVKIPFIAVPTTSGTGSEATKNAVLSETGENGYKRSLRHTNFVPNVAIIDPALTVGCPPSVTATSGMDAFTQLLESYLSTSANPVTDALAFEGLKRISASLPTAYRNGENIDARSDMAMAAYLSGITLANAGLGLVHGFAASIGGYVALPHGVICSSLMAATNKVTVRKLRAAKYEGDALIKYASVGKLFCDVENKSEDYYIDYLLTLLDTWRKEMSIPALNQSGVRPSDFKKIAFATDNKNNPLPVSYDEMIEILETAS